MKNIIVHRAFTAKKNINFISKRSAFVLPILFVLLTAFTTIALGATVEFTPTSMGGWTKTAGAQSGTKDGVTLSVTNGIIANNNTEFRFYASATMTIRSSTATISQIAFTISSGSLSLKSGSPGTYNSSTKKWTGTATPGTNIQFSNSGQVKFTSIVVTYTASSTYSITYDCDGAETGCPSPNVVTGQSALPNPLPSGLTKTGFTFDGWFTNSGKTAAAVPGAALTNDITLYAKWTTEGGGGGGGSCTYSEATTLEIDDKIWIISGSKVMTGASSGAVTDFSGCADDDYHFVVETGYEEGWYSLKSAYTETYLSAGTSTTISTATSKSWNTDWKLVNIGSKYYLKNSADSRYILYFTSGTNMRAYKDEGQSGTTAPTIYKQAGCTPATAITITCTNTMTISETLDLTYSGGNGGAVTWSVINGSGSATISGSTLTPTGVGLVTVKATQAKNGDICATSKTMGVTITAVPVPIRFYNNGVLISEQNLSPGAVAVKPENPEACDGKTFVGWWTEPLAADNTTSKTWVTNFTVTGAQDYYAIYRYSEGGGGETSVSFNFGDIASANSWSNSNSYPDVSIGDVSIHVDQGTGSYVARYYTSDKTWRIYSGNTVTISSSGGDITSVSSNPSRTFDISGNEATFSPGTTTQFKSITVTIAGGGTTYYTSAPPCGPSIRANDDNWITATKGQKVKLAYQVRARDFESASTLTIASNTNAHFNASLETDAIPSGTTGLLTNLIVEYLPEEYSTKESTTIVLQAGDVSQTLTINGRSLPEEFAIIAHSTDWYALPANMNDGPNQYDGVLVVPNNPTTPTQIPIAPSTIIYSLHSVYSSETEDRYPEHGECVRLAGWDDYSLWGNKAASNGTTIQNKTNINDAKDDNFEWMLNSTDGNQYVITCPANPETGAGRQLANGGTGGYQFGLYKNATICYIVPVGCSSYPEDIQVGTHRTDATFSWISNASEMTIKIYNNSDLAEGHLVKTIVATSSPKVVMDLEETTQYWFELIPDGNSDCAATGTFETTGPIIDVVEWQENAVTLFIDKGDINPMIVIDGEEEHGSISGGGGKELFFSKYFEGAGSMKLLAIFNPTPHTISLANYAFYDRHAGDGATSYGEDKEYLLSTLGSIASGQEIIFFTRPSESWLTECANAFLNDKLNTNSGVDANPRWIECKEGGTLINKAINFSGNDALLLKKDGTLIDIIGSAGTPPSTTNCRTENAWNGSVVNMDKGKDVNDPCFDPIYAASSKPHSTDEQKLTILTACGIDLVNDNVDIYSARCIIFRNSGKDGTNAVTNNTGNDFVTFTPEEWTGRSVCMTTAQRTTAGYSNDGAPTCISYQDLALFDFKDHYFVDYTSHINPGTALNQYSSDSETKEYTIPVYDSDHPDRTWYDYACLNVRFRLMQGETVLTETTKQVPIIVTEDMTTNNKLFSELVEDKVTGDKLYDKSVERCSTCDVVVLNNVTLTKGPDGAVNKDVPEIGNLKIYPGGQLIIPEGTNYTVKSIALRRQEDEVSSADIQGNLTVGTTNGVYFDMRVDPTSWHFISLPYDCNVSDIRFENEDELIPPVLGIDYLLMKYDGERRAATRDDRSWVSVAADETLKKGLGYIYSLPGSGKVRHELRFPMANEVITPAVERADKLVESVYGYGCDKTDEELRPNHKGWNLVGDPYLLSYRPDFESPLATGYLEHTPDPWDGKWQIREGTEALYYIVEPVYVGGYIEEYIQKALSTYEMKPFTSYFVQIGGTDPEAAQGIQFSSTGSNEWRHSIVRRAPKLYEEEEDTHPVWCAVEISSPEGEMDETTLLVSDNFTDNYDMMRDLVKMRGPYYSYFQHPILASRNNEGEMAFNALPDASAAAGVPLNYFAASTGEYTIAYNDKYGREEIKAVMLNDKQTGQWIDLMEDSYTFASNRVDNTDRFVLIVRVERKKTPENLTDIENLYNGTEEGPRKLLINGHVYIMRGGQLFDITGKQVKH